MRYFQITCFCFALFSSVLSSCGPGTIACDNSTSPVTPKICDFFNSYTLSSDRTKCEQRKVANCEIPAIPNSSAACFKCSPGFVLDTLTQKCTEVNGSNLVENCDYYQMSGTIQCSICKMEYFFENGQCKAVPQEKIENCLIYMSATSCRLCKSGTFLKDGKCEIISDIKNCHYHREIECEKCKDNYYQDPGANKKHSNANFIIQNFDFSSYLTENLHYASWHSDFVIQTCSNSKFENCRIQTSYDKCDECEDKFYVDSLGRCTRNQYPPIKNCETYQSNLLCQECEVKFYLEQNVCNKVTDVTSCEKYSKTSNKCAECKSTHSLNNDGSKCVLKTNLSARIETCPDDNCQSCAEGFTISSDGSYCLENIEYCSEHNPHAGTSTVLTCKTCDQGYDPNSQRTFCVPSNVSSCYEYSHNLNKCKACEAGYYLSSSNGSTTCVSRSGTGGEGCVSNKANRMNGSCDSCEEGYNLVTRNVALKDDAFFSACAKIDQQTGDCLQCAENAIGQNNICQTPNLSRTNGLCLQMKEGYFGEDMENNCGKCKNSQDYYLEDNQCKPRSASEKTNCLDFYDDRDLCQTCQQGYFPKATIVETEKYPTCQEKAPSFSEISNCLIYNSDYTCQKCINKTQNVLFDPNPSCDYEEHQLAFYFNADLQKDQPSRDYKIDNCAKYHQIELGKVECIKCEDTYVGILPDLSNSNNLKYYLDPETLSLKMYFESCENRSRAFKDSTKTPSVQNGGCESAVKVSGWEGFMCVGCGPGTYPVGGELHYDAEGNEKSMLRGVVACAHSSDLKRKYLGLGMDKMGESGKIPLGNMINFDSCEREDEVVTVSMRPLDNGLVEFYENDSFLFEPEGIISCVHPSNMKTAIVDNCLIYLNAKLDDQTNGCLVCRPGYQAQFSNGSEVASSCRKLSNCEVDESSKLLHRCENPLYGWESTSSLADVRAKSSPGNVAECLVYKMNSVQCSLCKKGFSLIGGQCIDVTAKPEYNCSEEGFGVSDLTLPTNNSNEALINTHLFFEVFLSFRDKPVNFCSECKEGYILEFKNYFLNCENGSTIPSSDKINNCSTYKKTRPALCASCESGYLLNTSTGKCVSNSGFSNCEELKGSVSPECSKCQDGYLYEDNECTLSYCQNLFNGNCSLCQDGFINKSGSKKICKANPLTNDDCEAYSPINGTCGKCKNNKLLYVFRDKNTQVISGFSCEDNVASSTAEFLDGLNLTDGYHIDVEVDDESLAETTYTATLHHLDTDDSLPKKYFLSDQPGTPPSARCLPDRASTNCKVPYLMGGIFCTKCEDGKTLNSSNICVTPGDDCNLTSTCESCDNKYLSEGRCFPYSSGLNCDQFDPNADKCTTCADGFVMENEKCVSEGRDPNCQTFGSNDVCIVCKTGFLLNSTSGRCEERTAQNCKEEEPTVDKCKVCLDNHYMDSSDGDKCKPYTNVTNCAKYNPTQDKCDLCENDTYLDGETCSSVDAPITNCKYYSDSTTCSTCLASFFLIDNKCPEGQVTNCAVYKDQDPNTCLKCVDGYFVESPSKCTQYSSDLNCLTFSENSDECTSCSDQNKLNSDKKCVPKDDTCASYEQDQMNCAQCKEEYWLDLSTRDCKARTETNCETYEPNADKCIKCAENFHKDTNDDNKCKPNKVIPNCEEYSSNADQCSKCASGYFLEDNICWSNPDGIEHCIKYSDLNMCSECKKEFYLNGNKCESLTNPVQNCQVHSSPTECETCVLGYFLKSKVECLSNNLSNCDEQLNETSCKKCASNYVLQRNQNGLKCVESGIQNCLTAIGGSTNTCSKCAANYVPSLDGSECKPISQLGIQNCSEYQTELTCLRCDINYIRSLDCSKCISRGEITDISNESLNTNCISEVMKKNPVCSECKPGYRKGMHGDCVSCGGNGCAICGDDARGDICLVCGEGFYMNAEMECVLKDGTETIGKEND